MPTEKRARQKAARREKLEAQRRAAKRKKQIRTTGIVVVVAALIITSVAVLANSGKSKPATTTTLPAAAAQVAANKIAEKYGCPGSPDTTVTTPNWSTPPAYTLDASKNYYATFKTTAGTFVEKLNTTTTKVNTNNFVFLADHNYYKCTIFGRVLKGSVDQGGYTNTTTKGGVNYKITENEYPTKASNAAKQYAFGDLAYANSGSGTNGSQFFVVAGPQGEALPPSYTDIGTLVSGGDVVSLINEQGADISSQTGTPTVIQRVLNVKISNSL